jgi:16S rRNA (cytosine967-C5)-methyltransferase
MTMDKPPLFDRIHSVGTRPTARLIAVALLDRIETTNGHAEPLLAAALSGAKGFSVHDRGLLTELVYGTLRMRGHLDWIIGQFYRGDPARLETTVRNTLRTAVYQLRFCDRIPPFAAVDEAVRIVKTLRPFAAGLVNAVLRSFLRGQDAIAWPAMDADPAAAIAAVHSHPPWLVRRWLAEFGVEEAIAICRANNCVAPLTVRVNTLKATRGGARAALAAAGLASEPARFSPDGLLISSAGAILRDTEVYREGWVRIQDEASQLVSRLAAPQPGERILDLCAGGGGKTLHLAALMRNQGCITALDRHADRLRQLREEAGRLGVSIVVTRRGDALEMPESFSGAFDCVLLDAPCSGLGTLRRNPEIRWRITPEDLEKCMQLQSHLLAAAARCVRPGGRLVYSVCAVTLEENEQAVAGLLEILPELARIWPAAGDIPSPLLDAAGCLKTFPHRHGTDGFFAAALERRSGSGRGVNPALR